MIAIYLIIIVLCTINLMKAERPLTTALWGGALFLNLVTLYAVSGLL